MMSQGGRIKSIRGALTQKEFAARLGITAQAVINYERYGRVPSKAVLNKILNVYNIRPEWLLTGEGEMYAPAPEGSCERSKTSDMSEVLKSEISQHIDFNDCSKIEKSDMSEVLRMAEQSLALQRELLEMTRQNGDLRVEVERQRARIAELERQLAEALSPSGGQALLDKRSAAAG